MLTGKVLLGAALTCIASLGIHATGSAQENAGTATADAAGADMRSLQADRALLEALVRRRAEVARSAYDPESKRAALDFLDRRIAEARGRIRN